MQGHQEVVQWRIKGRVPPLLEVETGQATTCLFGKWCAPDSPIGTAIVHIPPSDPLRRLDLRFAVGLHVHVDGDDDSRVQEVFEAFKQAGAQRVQAFTIKRRGEEFQTVRIRDSQGNLTWPEL